MKQRILDALNDLVLCREAWCKGEDVITVGGKPVGGSFSGNKVLWIEQWWPILKAEIAEHLAKRLAEPASPTPQPPPPAGSVLELRCDLCGALFDASPDWRFSGSAWEHSHPYPIGHVVATYR